MVKMMTTTNVSTAGASFLGMIETDKGLFLPFLFFSDDDRVEIFNDGEESIGLVYTSSSEVLFKGKQIGRVRYPFPDEPTTIKLVLENEDGSHTTVDSHVPTSDVECFIKAEKFFTEHLIKNNIITVE